MSQRSIVLTASAEDVLAKFTEAAYQAVLRRGFAGPFIDVELELWQALSATLASLLPPEDPFRVWPATGRSAPQLTRADLIDIRERVEYLTSVVSDRKEKEIENLGGDTGGANLTESMCAVGAAADG